MQFTSQYNPPVRFRAGGGAGLTGICAMEVLYAMTEPHSKYLDDDVKGVNQVLRLMVTQVNDMSKNLSEEERADALWPILPRIFNTGTVAALLDKRWTLWGFSEAHRFPALTFADALGIDLKDDPFTSVYSTLRNYTRTQENETIRHDFGKGVHFLKTAVEVYWQAVNDHTAFLQKDFTEEQMGNLNRWIHNSVERIDEQGRHIGPSTFLYGYKGAERVGV